MALSTKWNLADNIYSLNRVTQIAVPTYNNGVMGLFETSHDGKVNKCIVDYAATHNRKETLLYNNRLYMDSPMGKVHGDQYDTNRAYILTKFSAT